VTLVVRVDQSIAVEKTKPAVGAAAFFGRRVVAPLGSGELWLPLRFDSMAFDAQAARVEPRRLNEAAKDLALSTPAEKFARCVAAFRRTRGQKPASHIGS
jgi:hypothetical protein